MMKWSLHANRNSVHSKSICDRAIRACAKIVSAVDLTEDTEGSERDGWGDEGGPKSVQWALPRPALWANVFLKSSASLGETQMKQSYAANHSKSNPVGPHRHWMLYVVSRGEKSLSSAGEIRHRVVPCKNSTLQSAETWYSSGHIKELLQS